MNNLSPALIAQLMGQESDDPFLTLLTLSHPSFSDVRLVNNSENVISNGLEFQAFPFQLRLPADDGESAREVSIEFDNVSLELINEIRSVTSAIHVKMEMILASIPDDIQYEIAEMKINTLSYNKDRVSAKLSLDGFLNTEMTSEKYSPDLFPGLF